MPPDLVERITSHFATDAACGCEPVFEGEELVVDASDCPGGSLAGHPDCRETVVSALERSDVERILVSADGLELAYEDDGAALLVAAGRFAERAAVHDEAIAARARREPLRAARDAVARAGPVATIAARTGLAEVLERPPTEDADSEAPYRRVLRPFAGPTVARSRVRERPPDRGRLLDVRSLETDAVARIYDTPDGISYHLTPVESTLGSGPLATLADAYECLASTRLDARVDAGSGQETFDPAVGGTETGDPDRSVGEPRDPERAPGRAVRAVADEDDPVVTLTDVLRKHTRGYGVLDDLFADPRVSDVYATAPVADTPLRVVVDGTEAPTNVRLTDDGGDALASRLRRESGRAFSRASPTLDASADLASGQIRVAGVGDPVSDGVAFAFRDHGREAWTLPALVENGTMPARAAAFLSVAVRRDVAGLVAGTRGAGKTTLLGALLWELPSTTRTVVIEDTPELPVDALLDENRDVQALRTAVDDGPGITPTEALRTALRLGDGALVLGEVRGEEAAVLYEAMRVGASANAVLGTIHGDGASAVRERVVGDLGVPESSFAATGLVVTVSKTGAGDRRSVAAIEEVVAGPDGVRFEALFELDGSELAPTGRIGRGDSRFATALARPGETYADLQDAIDRREEILAGLARSGQTDPGTVVTEYSRTSGRRGDRTTGGTARASDGHRQRAGDRP